MNVRAIAAAVAVAALPGCAASVAKAPETPLPLSPVVALAPAAGLESIAVVCPKELYADASLLPALQALLPPSDAAALARRHGGADLRELDELVFASYPHATLVLARGVFDPAKIEATFSRRAINIEGRAIDHAGGALSTITRVWGEFSSVAAGPNAREQLAIFGLQAVAIERDDVTSSEAPTPMVGPLRAAELFALRKLAKAKPALAAPPLAAANAAAGEGAVKFMLPGPFSGQLAGAMGGMLSAATAIAAVARPSGGGHVKVRVVITGAFGDQAPRAAEKVAALADLIASSAMGRLAGLDHPVAARTTMSEPESVTLDCELDALALVRGLRAAAGASVEEVLGY